MSFNPQQPTNGRPMPPNFGQASGPQQPYASPGTGHPHAQQQWRPSNSGLPGPQSYSCTQPGHAQSAHDQPGYGQPVRGGPQPFVDPILFNSQSLPEAAYGPGSERFWLAGEHERSAAMWAHLGAIFFGLMPLIMFLVKKDESPFVREHSRQGLNAMITNTVITTAAIFVLGFLGLILAFVTFGLGVLIMYAALIVPVVYTVIYIIAAVAANRGQGCRFPLVFEFVK